MLRYQLYECNGNKVSLKKEIAYLKDYISVQQLRKNKNLQLQFEITGNERDTLIEPLLLIPLVENAFKHLSNFDNGKKDIINISVDAEKDNLVFTVENTISTNAVEIMQNESGIGLNNIRRRLELLYPGKHRLNITNNGECFKTQLEIELN